LIELSPRFRNRLAVSAEGGVTLHLSDGGWPHAPPRPASTVDPLDESVLVSSGGCTVPATTPQLVANAFADPLGSSRLGGKDSLEDR
jgi:hypothetical protein